MFETNDIFKSFFAGGFECSSHRRRSRRLDLIESTGHDRCALEDYRRLQDIGIETARDGLRWHLIETAPGEYDFSSAESQVRAMQETGIQVVWDLFHYGYPDDIDIFSEEFPHRFAQFARSAAEYLAAETPGRLTLCPVNEISFFSWIGGEVGHFHPKAKKSGDELKRQLVRAAVAGMDAIREAAPETVFIHTDPAIHVIGAKNNPESQKAALRYKEASLQGFDMLMGMLEPELGGGPEYVDVIGLNYYFHNQWRYPNRRKIPVGHPDYLPFSRILGDVFERYKKPIFIAETGIEDEERPEWFRYICEQTMIAIDSGVPVLGICWYPIVNHPGWEDDRHCHNGLWDYLNDLNEREAYMPLKEEILRQREIFESKFPKPVSSQRGRAARGAT